MRRTVPVFYALAILLFVEFSEALIVGLFPAAVAAAVCIGVCLAVIVYVDGRAHA